MGINKIMYYLNSDGTPDKTQENTEAFCQCDQCRRKRKRKPCYKWFSWTNIFILVILVGIIISLTCNNTKFMNDMYASTSPYNPFASSPSSSSPSSTSSTTKSLPPPVNVADDFAEALF